MKKWSAVVLLALAVPCLAFGQATTKMKMPSSQAAEQAVMAAERAWIDAALKYDVSWFERNLADTFVNTDEEGVVTNKASMIDDVTNRADSFEDISYLDLKVRTYGDTAVATGIVKFKGTHKGKELEGTSQFTDTWILKAGQWQCVASQATYIKQ